MSTLREMRVEVAKTLLLGGERLAGIAARIGFCDGYHLSRTFKQVTGLSPKSYLASLRREEPSK